MSLTKSFKTDNTKEVAGIRVPVGFNEDKTEVAFYLSRMSRQNPAYTRELEKATKPYSTQIRTKTISETVAAEIALQVFVTSILRGWENVLLSDVTGNPEDKGFAEFTQDNAKKLFKNLPELLDHLSNEASDVSNFRSEELEEDAKN